MRGATVNYAATLDPVNTPQSEPLPGQVQNSAGGYTFALDDFGRLHRFLVLGNEGGTYYAAERKLTLENAACVERCIEQNGLATVSTIATISEQGRAPKNDAAIFALALCASKGDEATKRAALDAMPSVCRTGTHLFAFVDAVQRFRGWGRQLRRAVGAWYLTKSPSDAAYQMVKYRQRNGWTHRDVLRLAHPSVGDSASYNALFHWATKGTVELAQGQHLPPLVGYFEQLQAAANAAEVLRIIAIEPSITWEMIPTEFLVYPDVWSALLPKMPLTAMIRNLGRMTANGLITPLSHAAAVVAAKLGDAEHIRRSRLHPLTVLSALATYKQGHGVKGHLSWTPNATVVAALEKAFYDAFDNVPTTNKRHLLALDVSGSMAGGTIGGVPGITPRIGSAVMSLVTARREPQHHFICFTAGSRLGGNAIGVLGITPQMDIDTVVNGISNLPFGGTDCALPMLYATKQRIPVDTFVIYTDNETWAGNIHASVALKEYRQKMGIGAKLIVVGMTATGFTIADPNDAGMLDVVGFDSAAPALMAQFSAD